MALSRNCGKYITCTLSSPAITREAQAKKILKKNSISNNSGVSSFSTNRIWGAINRQQAEHALSNACVGDFLIRDKRDGVYALSIMTGTQEFEHHQLSLNVDGDYAINGEVLDDCRSLNEVVDALSCN
eukprot:UC4_evm1s596